MSICESGARRFRGCLPMRRARRRSSAATGLTKCTKPLTGVDLYGDALSWTPFRSAAHADAAGEAMARMHLAAEGFDAPRRKVQPLVASFTIFAAVNPRVAMEKYLAARPALAGNARVWACAAQALELLSPFHAGLRRCSRSSRRCGRTTICTLPTCCGAMSADAERWRRASATAEGRRSSTSAWPTAPTPSTISPTPLSATSWSGSCWSRIPTTPTRCRSTSIILRRCLTATRPVRPLSAEEPAALAPMTRSVPRRVRAL